MKKNNGNYKCKECGVLFTSTTHSYYCSDKCNKEWHWNKENKIPKNIRTYLLETAKRVINENYTTIEILAEQMSRAMLFSHSKILYFKLKEMRKTGVIDDKYYISEIKKIIKHIEKY